MKPDEERIEMLRNDFHNLPIEEHDNINRILRPINYSMHNRSTNLESLARLNMDRGFTYYYVYHDIKLTKHFFYLGAKLLAETCKYPYGWDMGLQYDFIFPILSDNPEIIKTYAHLDTLNSKDQIAPLKEYYKYPKEDRFYVLLLQHLLRKDWNTIEVMWKTYQDKVKRKLTLDIDEFTFYFALRDGKTDVMQEIIYKYLSPRAHKGLNKYLSYEFSGELWSHRPTMFSKLAAMFGYELDIKSDMIPTGLIPVCPLEHYDDYYDFFAPGFDWEAGLRKPRTLLDILLGRNKHK